ncbi:MAG: hypothetical protein V1740_04030 [Candidatus Woesearchaeota archaeon]
MGQRPFFESGSFVDRGGFGRDKDLGELVREDPGVDCDFSARGVPVKRFSREEILRRARDYRAIVNLDDLPPLVKFGVYRAIPRSTRGRNPAVTILANGYDDEESPYYGYVWESKSPDFFQQREENQLRQRLVDHNYDLDFRLNVKVIVLPRDPGDGKGGPYFVVATHDDIRLPPEETFDMTSAEAHAVVCDDTIFYAQVKRVTEKHNLSVGVFDTSGRARHGYLDLIRDTFGDRRFSEYLVSQDMIGDYDKKGLLKPGDHVLVRQVATNPSGRTLFFEPVVNFLDYDHAFSTVDGHELRTRVEDDEIFDLPLFPSKKTTGDVIGYIPRPPGDGKRFFYKQVVFNWQSGMIGKIAEHALIYKDLGGVFLAEILDAGF